MAEVGGSDSLRSTLAGSHEYMFDYCCDLCERDGLQKEADGFCADCQDYLCSECFNYHLKPKPSRHHVLLDQHQMPKDQQQHRGGDTCTEACPTHPHKTVEYYCTQHDELGCSVCMTLNHRICKGVEHILDIANDILNSEEYVEFQNKVTSLTQVANTAIQTSQDQSKSSKIYHAKALDDFKQYKIDVCKAVDIIEKNLIKETDRIKDDDEKKMKLLENKYKNVLKDIQALVSKLTSLQNNGQFCQLFIAVKRAKRDIHSIETSIGNPELNMKAMSYRMIKSSEMQLFIDTAETMVKLEVENEAQPGSNPTQTATSHALTRQLNKRSNQVTVSPLKHKPLTDSQQEAESSAAQHKITATTGPAAVQHGKEVKIKRAQPVIDIRVESTDDQKLPIITGCVVLSGNKLVVVDENNGNVKLVDLTHNKIVCQLKLGGGLWDITQGSGTNVAVTSPNTQTIYFVNVNANQLKQDHTIKVNGKCQGIASINDKLVVSYADPAKVEIINMEGEVLHTVIPKDKAGLFSSPWYVAVGTNEKNIYISDWGSHTVTSVDLTGQVLATHTSDKLVQPRGLTIDSAGRVYVCGAAYNILQLTADLTDVQRLLQKSDGVDSPRSVYYCKATDRLYVGMLGVVMKVYQLK